MSSKFWLDFDFVDFPETKRFAEILEVDQAQATGHIIALFCAAAAGDTKGDLTGWDMKLLAEAMEWKGDIETMMYALTLSGILRSRDGKSCLIQWAHFDDDPPPWAAPEEIVDEPFPWWPNSVAALDR